MKGLSGKYYASEALTKKPMLLLITFLNSIISLFLFIVSLIVGMDGYVTVVLLTNMVAAAGFFLLAQRDRLTKPGEILFFVITYLVFLPIEYVVLELMICEIPIYFMQALIFTAVVLTGRRRRVLLSCELLEYIVFVWYVTIKAPGGRYEAAAFSPDIYIRFLLAIVIAGGSCGILLKYRNRVLLDEIKKGAEQTRRAQELNHERDAFMENMSHEIRKPLMNILGTTEMLLDMDIDVQREEDILYIDNSAKRLLHMPDKLMNSDKEQTDIKREEVTEKTAVRKVVCPDAKILVVDDNIINLEIIKSMMDQFGCCVKGAMSGIECLEILSEEETDLVFLDYMMPEMDGIETLRRIRERETAGTKKTVIALTADVESGAKEKFMEAGFDDYMAKPVDLRSIQENLEKFLSEKIIEV